MKGTALIDGQFKLIQAGRGKGVQWELFDLEKDPQEMKSISDDPAQAVENLLNA